jgi:hypothetical protein
MLLVCCKCARVNPLDAETCLGCGGTEFETLELAPPPFYNSIEPYDLEKQSQDGEQKTESE